MYFFFVTQWFGLIAIETTMECENNVCNCNFWRKIVVVSLTFINFKPYLIEGIPSIFSILSYFNSWKIKKKKHLFVMKKMKWKIDRPCLRLSSRNEQKLTLYWVITGFRFETTFFFSLSTFSIWDTIKDFWLDADKMKNDLVQCLCFLSQTLLLPLAICHKFVVRLESTSNNDSNNREKDKQKKYFK